MKKILIGFLFLLGAAEIVWPVLASLHRYAFEPHFLRAFDFSKFTEELEQTDTYIGEAMRAVGIEDWTDFI